jgi:hypothetical protein
MTFALLIAFPTFGNIFCHATADFGSVSYLCRRRWRRLVGTTARLCSAVKASTRT